MSEWIVTWQQVTWGVPRDQIVAHAFGDGIGWMRSLCGRVQWQASVRPAVGDELPCEACEQELYAAAVVEPPIAD